MTTAQYPARPTSCPWGTEARGMKLCACSIIYTTRKALKNYSTSFLPLNNAIVPLAGNAASTISNTHILLTCASCALFYQIERIGASTFHTDPVWLFEVIDNHSNQRRDQIRGRQLDVALRGGQNCRPAYSAKANLHGVIIARDNASNQCTAYSRERPPTRPRRRGPPAPPAARGDKIQNTIAVRQYLEGASAETCTG
ncbi:hypothetical protein EVAR_46400_1 [Eumeta japonica]|uniref:Uncharacterized protein n=1 Tax=Eumeta variegata TaxID=151549 RepID=A0A4C1WW18_EUMVA|nr:hypothetical protein EVAR_46400_1 [Eumeta japonica]